MSSMTVTYTQAAAAAAAPAPTAQEKRAQEAEAAMKAAAKCLPEAAGKVVVAWANVFSAKEPAKAALQIDFCIARFVAPQLIGQENKAAFEKFKVEALRIKKLIAPTENAVLGLHAFEASVKRHDALQLQAAAGNARLQQAVDVLYAKANAANEALQQSYQASVARQEALLRHISAQKATLEKSIDTANNGLSTVASTHVVAASVMEQAGGGAK